MFDLDRLTMAINSGRIGLPPGLSHAERTVYIRDKLKELGIEVEPLGRKYDPEAVMAVMRDYLQRERVNARLEEV